MVEIIEYSVKEENFKKKYFELILELYGDNKISQNNISNLAKLLDENNPFFNENKIFNFIALENGVAIGNISAIIDTRMLNKKIGIFGFFECVKDKEIVKQLLLKAESKLKSYGCEYIVGPINLTILNSYRFALKQDLDSYFLFEPFSKEYYDSFFLEEGFDIQEEYYSASRENFDSLIDMTKKSYENLIKERYNIRNINMENLNEELEKIYSLSKEIFNESKNYVDFTKEEFFSLYLPLKNFISPEFVNFVVNPYGKEVGFCFSIRDSFNKDNLIMKTLAVKKEERKKGIAAAILFFQHDLLKKSGFKKAIYALIRKGNNIEKLPYPDAKIIREYHSYIKKIK